MSKRNPGRKKRTRTAPDTKDAGSVGSIGNAAEQSLAGGNAVGGHTKEVTGESRVVTSVFVFYIAVFLSAFLLFQVQPLIGKAILPWFGGSPAVWTTSMLFFQCMLLLGYAAAHFAQRILSSRLQLIGYATLVVIACLLLPILPNAEWKPTGEEDPTWHILALLTQTIGLPFFVLSMNSPLLQVWFHRATDAAPYRLYALSNLGSMLGLLTFPFLIEPTLGLNAQGYVWSAGFLLLALFSIGCSFISSQRTPGKAIRDEASVIGAESTSTHAASSDSTDTAVPSWKIWFTWLLLSATASTLLLGITNHITQNVAVVPFFWVIPLAVYLSTFILVFASDRSYHRGWMGGLMVFSLFGCGVLFNNITQNIVISLVIHMAGLFAGCMVCHGELVRLKPDAKFLTGFYLAMSIGGAVGGLFVSLVAPVIFLNYWEYPIALTACWLILLFVAYYSKSSRLRGGKTILVWGLLICSFIGFLMQIRDGVIGAVGMLTYRDFYGVLAVGVGTVNGDPAIKLTHGTTVHGAQLAIEEREFEPTTYYVPESGLGDAMRYVQGKSNKRVGVVGMGVATIASYCEPGDTFRFYEIDPSVIRIATDPEIFTFWSLFEKRQATTEIVVADARIALERELANGQSQQFDVLVLDAFSGDAVPVHLLTREAFAVYQQHMAADAVIAVHISNRYLDLLPVISAAADDTNLEKAIVIHDDRSEWVLMSSPAVIQKLKQSTTNKMYLLKDSQLRVKWTDDFSNLYRVLKRRE